MNTKILSKVTKNVQFRTKTLESGKIEYTVERKIESTGEWDTIARTTNLERALIKKHNAWMSQLHFLNLTHILLRRRKHKKQKFFCFKIN